MFRIEHYSSIANTMELARKRAEEGEEEGLVIWADEISQALGRQGRKWYASRGGLWISLILRPQISPLQASVFNYLSSLTAHRALQSLGALPISIKWPNDLLWENRKLGGILVWGKVSGKQVEYLIWGIGINVKNVLVKNILLEKMEGGPKTALVATSLKKEGVETNVEKLLCRFLNDLEESYSHLQKRGYHLFDLRKNFESICSTLGQMVRIDISQDQSFEGKAVGLDKTTGGLLVESQGEVRSFEAGDCIHLREL